MQQHLNIQIDGPHGKPILLDIYHNDKPQPLVIFCHGFKGFKDFGCWDLVAKQFVGSELAFVKFNFSHNGTTPDDPLNFGDLEAFGQNNFSIELDDLGAVIDFMAGNNVAAGTPDFRSQPVYLIGHSRGGGTVLLKPREDQRVSAVATWASISEFGRYWPKEEMHEWRQAGVKYIMNGRTKQQMPLYWQLYENFEANRGRLDIPAAVKSLKTPLLIVHGDNDMVVKLTSAEALAEWHPAAELCVISEGDHTFGSKHPWPEKVLPASLKEATEQTIRFFRGIQ